MRRWAWVLISLIVVCDLTVRAAGPALTTISEALFGGKSGSEKKQAALSFVTAAIGLTDAIANKQVVDADKFENGLSKVVDGVCDCFNASAWAK